ncbi:MAG: hypothetical protein ACO2O0_05615 [Desulfurococcales archaeon]
MGSLWGRWKSLDATGSKPVDQEAKHHKQKNINNHRGTSGYHSTSLLLEKKPHVG